MAKFISSLFGAKSTGEKNAARAANDEAANNRKIQEISQAQQIQQQGQEQAALDTGLSSARKAGRGRRLLMDAGSSSKTTVG